MSFWMRIGGYAATEIAAHTPPTWETWADGGSGTATWEFALSMHSQHQALRVGALVEVMCGALPVFSGALTEPDRTTWQCTAYGFAAIGKSFPALSDTGTATRDLQIASANAAAMGWNVTDPTGITGIASGDGTGAPISVAQLWDQYAEQTGQRWGVDHKRRLYMRADPTAPTWLASPGAAAFGTTDEDDYRRIIGPYIDSTSGVEEQADAGSGYPVGFVDLKERGPMSLAEANAILAGALVRSRGPKWTNGVTLTRDQLQTMGGTPAFLPAVRGGQLMRSFGLSNASRVLALDTVIGKTRYTAGDEFIYIEPVNTAPRNLSDVIAAA